jgi:hydroxymethylglutaryl-CoA lyase
MEMSVRILGLGDADAVKNARTAMRYGRTPLEGLPDRVMICEVGPRDGLQNESTVLPVEVKAEFVARLVDAGHTIIETTSFVHPKWVPQLADAEALLTAIRPAAGVRYPVLVPNERGLDRALDLGVRDIAVFGSATETFARRNLNRTVDESLQMFAPVVARAREAGLSVRGYLSMCFGDPWEGEVPVARVTGIAARMMALGCTELSIGDTIGVATPGRVVALLDALSAAGIAVSQIAVHFHDTYGQALANTLAALRRGVTTVDASAGGLGGCPYAGSATGNLATEDLLWQLEGLGIATGVDLQKMVDTSLWMARELGRPSPSRTVTALAGRRPGQEGERQ